MALALLVILLPMLGAVLIACRGSTLGCHRERWALLPAAASFLRKLAFVPADCRGAPYCCPLARSRTLSVSLFLESDGLRLLLALRTPRIGPFSGVGQRRHLDISQEEMAKPHRHTEERLAIAAPYTRG